MSVGGKVTEQIVLTDSVLVDTGEAAIYVARTPAAGARGASPFGLIMRAGPGPAPPFAGWAYQADYLPPDRSFLVGENSDILAEPLCVCMPRGLPRPAEQPISGEPFARLSELRVHVPVSRPSPALEQIGRTETISLVPGSAHLLEVVFDDEQAGQSRDLRPDLPLVIRW